MKIGAHYLGNGRCGFVVWAPFLKDVAVRIVSPEKRAIPMEKDEMGYWRTAADDVFPGTLYLYSLGGSLERPDPVSHFQPQGVHGPSQVVDHGNFKWEDGIWSGIPLEKMIIYEIHVGAFTSEGTFEAIIPRINDLINLGVNAIEIMPVAQFPGERNWGYDGVYPFAVQNSYGGPEGMRRLVNICHGLGMAVILDVVYNHLGPEGSYLRDFGPYFTEKYKTPWGNAINFDGAYSNEVRNFFIENALHWSRNYHVDALRLDAIHGIFDMSAKPFLQELAQRVEEFSSSQGVKFYLIAESDLNDSRVIRPIEQGGYGLDAQWCDDFHHSLHTLLTGEKGGYYIDFGGIDHFLKSIKEGFVYSDQYSQYRKRNHGNSTKDLPGNKFIVFSQNHDQVGNRMLGERLSKLVSFEALKLAAGAVILSPYIPLLFMGEEYGEESPFLYFVNHSNPELITAVREGRKSEFQAFGWQDAPPDPQSQASFLRSKINWGMRKDGKHKVLLEFYRRLIKLRMESPALINPDKNSLEVTGVEGKRLVFLRRRQDDSRVFSVMNFNCRDVTFRFDLPGTGWIKVIDSSEARWMGSGSLIQEKVSIQQELTVRPFSFVLFKMGG